MTGEQLAKIRSAVGEGWDISHPNAVFLLAALDRVTRERDEARAAIERVRALADELEGDGGCYSLDIRRALSGTSGTPREPQYDLDRCVIDGFGYCFEHSVSHGPEVCYGCGAAVTKEHWQGACVESAAVSGGTAQDEPPWNHQRYESCVTDTTGRCTRFSHDHSAEDDAQTECPSEKNPNRTHRFASQIRGRKLYRECGYCAAPESTGKQK